MVDAQAPQLAGHVLAPLALELASRVYLLSLGRIVAELDPRDITSHDDLAQHYFA